MFLLFCRVVVIVERAQANAPVAADFKSTYWLTNSNTITLALIRSEMRQYSRGLDLPLLDRPMTFHIRTPCVFGSRNLLRGTGMEERLEWSWAEPPRPRILTTSNKHV